MGSNVLMQKLVFVAQIASQAVLYVLLALSVLSIGVIIERWWYFRRRRDNLDALSDKLRRAFGRGDLEAARKALSASPSVEAEIVREALDWYDDGPEAVEQILAKATRVLGTQEEAEQWLKSPAIGLDQKRPIDLLTTPAGVRLVEDYLGRLEYDVYT